MAKNSIFITKIVTLLNIVYRLSFALSERSSPNLINEQKLKSNKTIQIYRVYSFKLYQISHYPINF